jgi:hypothetical protein
VASGFSRTIRWLWPTKETVSLDGDALDIQVRGMHKLWALKSSLRVPLANVRDVRHDPERARRVMPGLRVPGTHIPYVYTAGTSYQADFDGRTVLFTLVTDLLSPGELHLLDVETGTARLLLPNAMAGRVVATGHLVFLRESALWAVPFDARLTGPGPL